jgi:hypothetical protein
MANLCIGNILLAFNSAIEEASNFVNATGEGSDKVREASGTNASSLNNVKDKMDSVQKVQFHHVNGENFAPSIGPLVDVHFKTFRVTISTETNSFLNAVRSGESFRPCTTSCFL